MELVPFSSFCWVSLRGFFQARGDVRRAVQLMVGGVWLIITGDTDPALVRSMVDRGIAVHYKPLKMEMLQAFIRESTECRQA